MNEKLPGIKVVGNIDLSSYENQKKKEQEQRRLRQEKRENSRSEEEMVKLIDAAMVHSIPLIQERAGSFEGAPDNLLDGSGALNPNAFNQVYSQDEITDDIKYPIAEKKSHYQTHRLDLQEKYGTSNQDTLLEILEKEERTRDGNISEEVLFLLLNKISGDRYMTMKSSMYDDYANGTDLLLVDTHTGATICAFDATVSGYNSNKEKKMQRVQKRLRKGHGMRMKYGVTFEGNKMVLGKIDQIPPLLLDLDKKQLSNMLQKMDFNIDSTVSIAEQETITSLILDVENQIQRLDSVNNKFSYDAVYSFIAHLKNNLNYVSDKKTA